MRWTMRRRVAFDPYARSLNPGAPPRARARRLISMGAQEARVHMRRGTDYF